MLLFVKKFLLFSALQLILGILFWRTVPHDPGTYMAAGIDKRTRINAPSERRRLIFVGGSSLAFGLDSEAVAQALPEFKVINMGLHAGLGLDFILRETQASLRSGDVVILSLEYALWSEGVVSNSVLDALDIDPEASAFVDSRTYRNILDGFVALVGKKLRIGVAKTLGRNYRTRGYARSNFNDFGDTVAHRTMPPNLSAVERQMELQDLSHLEPGVSLAARAAVERFRNDAVMKQATVYYVAPSIPTRSYRQWKSAVASVERALTRAEVAILLPASNAALPRELFFDTYYHLAGAGVARRTELLLHALCGSAFRCVTGRSE